MESVVRHHQILTCVAETSRLEDRRARRVSAGKATEAVGYLGSLFDAGADTSSEVLAPLGSGIEVRPRRAALTAAKATRLRASSNSSRSHRQPTRSDQCPPTTRRHQAQPLKRCA